MSKFKLFQQFLELQPQARPGICTILVGVTIFIFSLVFTLAVSTSRKVDDADRISTVNWLVFAIMAVSVITSLVGSLQLYLYFNAGKQRRQKAKQRPRENGLKLSASHEDGRTDYITQTTAVDGTEVASLRVTHTGYRIFCKFRDPLVLRTPTDISFKCKFEFPTAAEATATATETCEDNSKLKVPGSGGGQPTPLPTPLPKLLPPLLLLEKKPTTPFSEATAVLVTGGNQVSVLPDLKWSVVDSSSHQREEGKEAPLSPVQKRRNSSVELPLAGVEVDGVVLRLVTDESREESEA